MSAPPDPTDRRRLHPLPRGLVELYGLIAVLMVLIPEWLADGHGVWHSLGWGAEVRGMAQKWAEVGRSGPEVNRSRAGPEVSRK